MISSGIGGSGSSLSTRAMSYGEKLALCAKITQLNGEALLGLMDIIKARDPSQLSYKADGDEWDFDLKSLKNDTLWAVREFVNQRFSKEQTTPRAYPVENEDEEDEDGVGVTPLAGVSGGSLIGLEDDADAANVGAYNLSKSGRGISETAHTGSRATLLRRSSSRSSGEKRRRLQEQQDQANQAKWRQNVASQQRRQQQG